MVDGFAVAGRAGALCRGAGGLAGTMAARGLGSQSSARLIAALMSLTLWPVFTATSSTNMPP
jgi:hypothetical protein